MPDDNKWTTGLCCSMAVALHQRTGYPIFAAVDHSWPDEGDQELSHAFVLSPDGRAIDGSGIMSLEEMCDRYLGKWWEEGIGQDLHPDTGVKGQWWICKLMPLSVEELCTLRQACNDPLDPELLEEANVWIDAHGILD